MMWICLLRKKQIILVNVYLFRITLQDLSRTDYHVVIETTATFCQHTAKTLDLHLVCLSAQYGIITHLELCVAANMQLYTCYHV